MKKVLVLLAAVSALSCSAFGAQISYTHTTPTTTTPFTDVFTLSSFNPALGTLTAIAINFSATTTATLSLTNITGSPQSFTNGTASVPLLLTAPSGTTSVTATAGPIAGSIGAGLGPYNFPGATGTVTAPTFNVAVANFGLYTLPTVSTVSLSVSGNTGTYGGTAPTGVFFGGSASAGGTTTITYTYNAPTGTPEPATMGLLGSALLGLGFVKLRKKA